jgi:hypothetical protein
MTIDFFRGAAAEAREASHAALRPVLLLVRNHACCIACFIRPFVRLEVR